MPTRSPEFEAAHVYSADQILFPAISYSSFTYPGDEEALATLKRVPGVPALLTYLQENFTEQLILVENRQQMVHAGPRCYRSIHKLVSRCAEILSCPMPDVYIANSPILNAYTVGHRNTCIVLHSALVEALTADELSFVIGHELGHIKCGHGLYRQLGDLLLGYWDILSSQIPVPGLVLVRVPLLLAYWEWYRRAELTCDRAGLLCLQKREPSLHALAKLAGRIGGLEDEIDLDSVMSQSDSHKVVNRLVLLVSILNNVENTHPFVPSRLRELKTYAESPEHDRVLHGQYDRDVLGIHEGGLRVECRSCGNKMNSKLKFCSVCGFSLIPDSTPGATTLFCTNCGSPVDRRARFCTICGTEQKQTLNMQEPRKRGLRARLWGS
jgi:Zn-dependent protease with chaperone function